MLRTLIVLHRYVGVLIGLMMTLWCLSGFVMMYQSMPELTPAERLRGLEPLRLGGAGDLARLPIADEARVSGLQLEMAAGQPLLRLSLQGEPAAANSLAGGQAKTSFTDAEILAIAKAYGAGHGVAGAPRSDGVITMDQWSVQYAKRNRPLHHLVFDGDPKHTELYVNGKTGEVVLDTNRRERVLSWLGAVPHWLYPTLLRQNGALWTQVVIWSSALGVFLTAAGLYIGIARLGRGRGGSISPYKGLFFWHHMTGLLFGVLTLTWVFSGLLTMNPWGWLESGTGGLRGQLAGTVSWSEAKAALTNLPPGAVQVSVLPLGGQARLLAVGADGETHGSPVQPEDIRAAFAKASLKLARLDLLTEEDSYYYAHHYEAPLPVFRATMADAQATLIYVDATTGQVVRAVDNNGRSSRWMSRALHDFDWPVIRARPIWDLVVIPLLLGVTAACILGTWMGISRIGLDFKALRRRRPRPR